MMRPGPFFLCLFLCCIALGPYPSFASSSQSSKVDLDFPTLEQQLVASIDQDIPLEKARDSISGYYNQNDVEMVKGFSLILQEDVYSYWSAQNKGKKNYALTLLIHLLANGASIPGDTMTIALAIANNHIYSIGDGQTRKRIIQDLIKHFGYYKKILSWQKAMNIRYDLAAVPVIPKAYWAHRQRNLDLFREITTLHLDQYLEFIDTIENLEAMHDIVARNNLANAESLIGLAHNIEQFTEKNLQYRATINQHRDRLKKEPDNINSQQAVLEYEKGEYTIDFMGKKRRWDLFYWLNYQMKLHREFGYFRGDCVTETTFQMNLYKAAGIPAMSNQVRPVAKGGFSHNSPLFYNFFFNKWDSIQFPRKSDDDSYVHFEKPVWHHLIYEKDGRKSTRKGREVSSTYWQGEKASGHKIVHFRTRGFTEDHFEKIFLSDITQQPGFIFNKTSAPELIPDTDNDGILDEFESLFNTNPRSADTDEDGFADLWEIEWGYNPSSSSSRHREDMVAIDGLAYREIKALNLEIVKDPALDYKADSEIYDIATIAAKLLEGKIYLAVTYHNDIRKNSRDIHTVRVSTNKDRNSKQMAFQWVRGKVYAYEVTEKGWVKQECNQQDFTIKTVEDTELIIPLSYFTDHEDIKIRYQATGLWREKSKNDSDFSEYATLHLKKQP